jgi:hypothetical protein
MVAFSRAAGLGLALVVSGLSGCGSDSRDAGDGGDDPSGGTTASGGSPATGGNGASGGSGSGAAAGSSTGGSGGSGGIGPLTCLNGVAGIWAAVNFPAYLEIDAECRVTVFCDIPNDYHTTGYVDGNLLVLLNVAMKLITVEGDVLTVIDAGSDGTDLPFNRQTSANAIPSACQL